MARACYVDCVTSARQVHYTYAEYLAALEVSELRLEYLDGEIFAMAGGSPEHGMIAARIIQSLLRYKY
jgi:Uma2 family endonuclease